MRYTELLEFGLGGCGGGSPTVGCREPLSLCGREPGGPEEARAEEPADQQRNTRRGRLRSEPEQEAG